MTRQTDPVLGTTTFDVMVDMDDVIVPWFKTVLDGCIRAWGPPSEPCTDWLMWKHWPGRDRDDWGAVVVDAIDTGLYETITPITGSVEAINILRWYGHRVHIVTARGFMERSEDIRRWTVEYLEEFGIGHDSLTFTKDKVAAQAELGVEFDWAIDDGAHNFEALQDGGVSVMLADMQHNQHVETPFRVADMWDFAMTILRAN